jgi:hypothetical protein
MRLKTQSSHILRQCRYVSRREERHHRQCCPWT